MRRDSVSLEFGFGDGMFGSTLVDRPRCVSRQVSNATSIADRLQHAQSTLISIVAAITFVLLPVDVRGYGVVLFTQLTTDLQPDTFTQCVIVAHQKLVAATQALRRG